MPHMVISYAKQIADSVDIGKLVQAVWTISDQTGLFKPQAIKVRALPVEHYLTGEGDQPFIHIDAKLFAGRTDEQKQSMVQDLFDAVNSLVGEGITISVEAIDMDQGTYLQAVSGKN